MAGSIFSASSPSSATGDEKRIVERIAFRFAIFSFCEFHEPANLQPMRQTAFMAGVVRTQVRLTLHLWGSNEIGYDGIGHSTSKGVGIFPI